MKTSKRREIQRKYMKDTKNERERGTSEKRKGGVQWSNNEVH